MKILVACEFSRIVSEAFEKMGHDVTSCDILPAEKKGKHYQGNVLDILYNGWDLMIAHPPCTYLCSSGLHWNKRRPERHNNTLQAIEFVKILWNAPINKICIENPIGILSSTIRKPDQIIQPYNFGHDASKSTCLWLKNLTPLNGGGQIEPRVINGKKRWANQTDSGQNNLAPSTSRAMERSRTYEGIAKAMATQWGNGII